MGRMGGLILFFIDKFLAKEDYEKLFAEWIGDPGLYDIVRKDYKLLNKFFKMWMIDCVLVWKMSGKPRSMVLE